MLNKELFKKEIIKAYEFTGQRIPNVEINKRMYEECIYLTNEEFIEGMRNLINTYEKVTLPNILKSLPKYKRYDEKGNMINTPKSIKEYCHKYLWKNYISDIILALLMTVKDKKMKDILEQDLNRILTRRDTTGINEFDAPPIYLKYINEKEYNKWNENWKKNRREIEQKLEYFFEIKNIYIED